MKYLTYRVITDAGFKPQAGHMSNTFEGKGNDEGGGKPGTHPELDHLDRYINDYSLRQRLPRSYRPILLRLPSIPLAPH